MAATTLTTVPATVRAGDSLLLSLALDSYPADESWTATFTLRAPNGTDISFSSTADADGSSHLFDVDYATTQQWTAGTYNGVARVTDGTTQHTFWTGRIEVLPDLTIQDANFDARSTWQKIQDNVLAVLENRASKAILSSTVNGVSLSNMSHDDLVALYDRARYEVEREADALQVAEGKLSKRNILFRFNAV